MLDSGAEGPRFKSQPRRCQVTVLGKLFTHIVPLFTKQQNWRTRHAKCMPNKYNIMLPVTRGIEVSKMYLSAKLLQNPSSSHN